MSKVDCRTLRRFSGDSRENALSTWTNADITKGEGSIDVRENFCQGRQTPILSQMRSKTEYFQDFYDIFVAVSNDSFEGLVN